MKILVVDDEIEVLDVFKSFLERCQHLVDLAATAQEALGLLRQGCYELAFIDYSLPDKTGLEVFGCIRKESPQTKVVMITGYSLMNESIARFAGVSDYLQKPITLDDIGRIIAKYKEGE